jgi:hypothetical protein
MTLSLVPAMVAPVRRVMWVYDITQQGESVGGRSQAYLKMKYMTCQA